MHRNALVLSLTCLTLAGMGACGTATPTGGGFIPGAGNAPGSAGATTAGTATATSGAGGAISAGTGGVSSGGTAGDSAASGAGSAGFSASVAGGGTGGLAGSGTVGVAGSSGSGRLPPVADSRGIYGHPDPAVTYPPHDGFTPYLVEEFNAPIDLNTDPFWTWGDGALADGRSRMVEKNIAFENGQMVLSLTDEAQQGTYSFSSADYAPTSVASSAEFRSLYNNFRYGRYEVRMKSPPGANYNFIHTMFAYRTPAFLKWREIDIELTAAPQTTFTSNIIIAEPPARVWQPSIAEAVDQYPSGDGTMGLLPGFSTSSDFHTYAFEWLPDQIKWFVDDRLVRVKKSGVGPNSLPVPSDSTKIIMNVWVFGATGFGGGDPKNNVYPIRGAYDWFRFYKLNSDATYPCLNTPSCLPPADLLYAKNNVKDSLPDVRPALCTGASGMQDTSCGP